MNKENLVDKNEAVIFKILAFFAILFWIAIIVGTLGIALIIILVMFLSFLVVQSGFISYLRGSGAIITKEQFPDIHDAHVECCQKLGLAEEPTLIIIHADGMFNALATRFLRKHYVILFSDIVDALADDPEALKFYIGHELGHIARKHLVWMPILAPVSFLPIIGAAYSRSREVTCDNYGLYCCGNKDSAVKAMSALIVGATRWKTLNVDALLKQTKLMGGFWMSYHEIVSDYPWTVRRVANLVGDKAKSAIPRRNMFAWFFAFFTPRLNLLSLIFVYILIIGIIQGSALMDDLGSDYSHDIEVMTRALEQVDGALEEANKQNYDYAPSGDSYDSGYDSYYEE